MQFDDGFQEIDLFLQLFHAAFRGERFKQRLLAFDEQIELRGDLTLDDDVHEFGNVLAVLCIQHIVALLFEIRTV